MNILVIGSGGREHALAWKAAQGKDVETVYVAPGNAGTALEPKLENLSIDVGNFEALADFAEQNNVALTMSAQSNRW
jgi:phosphoribosylamine--glycine ligase